MPEIKIGEGLIGQISSLRAAGAALNGSSGGSEISGGPSLTTCRMYADQQAAIQELISLYRQLVTKDANELDSLVQGMKDLDRQIAANT